MRTILTFLLFLGALATALWAQGAGPSGKETIAEKIRKDATAGPGYVQGDFLTDLGTNLQDQFGKDRGTEMLDKLKKQELQSKDTLDLLNGKTTKSNLQDMFGASRGELPKVQDAVQGAVKSKDRKLFFGIVIFVMVDDFDVDPSSDFCKQAAGARDEMSPETLEKMMKGNRSTKTIGEGFGFDAKADQKFMQEILNAVFESPMLNHPMCESMGMGSPKDFDASKFPTLGEGMPGFGGDFAGGMAGGLPFDQKMPPCPFMGGNMDAYFPADGATGSK